MKKRYALLLTPLFLFLVHLLPAQHSLVCYNPLEWWAWGWDVGDELEGQIEMATIRVEPAGLYANVELELTIAAAETAWYWTESDTLEVVLHFDLPQDAIVYDSYLWINDEQVQADIFERNFGVIYYESFVERRQDPSLLLKMNQGKYQLRIFPLPAFSSRKIRIDYRTPILWKDGVATATLPTQLLQTSASSNFPVQLELRDNANYTIDGFSNPGVVFSGTGNTQTATVNAAELRGGEFISWALPTNNGVWLEVDPIAKAYQFLFDTRSQIPAFESARDIAVVLNFSDATAETDAATLKQTLARALAHYLTPSDRVALFTGSNPVPSGNGEFWFTTAASLNAQIGASNPSTTGNLSDKLRAANVFLNTNSTQRKMLLVVTSEDLTNAEWTTWQQWFPTSGSAAPTYLLDVIKQQRSSSYYYDRSLLRLNNILQLHGGFTSRFGALEDRLFQALEHHSIQPGILQLDVAPENGLTYQRFGNLATSNGNGIRPLYREFGKYVGSGDWTADLATFQNNEFLQANFVANIQTNADGNIPAAWLGNKLKNDEQLPGSKVAHINESIAARILSLYTVFLALDPAITGDEECTGCEVQPNDVLIGTSEVNPTTWAARATPNPFTDAIRLSWAQAPATNQLEVSIYNAQGQLLVQQTVASGFADGTPFFEYTAAQGWPSGAYFVKISMSSGTQLLKLIKR
ncbi:MAG: hypothetical protein DA408_04015 [Bacteroidetes bacterium]|nr:MAG: hypothetical protein C7N36_07970 [Bacteroidota bacterium]PTM14064.1 MAG: hypothetical protein DA408_04015 [Bacteroidota bacterium]